MQRVELFESEDQILMNRIRLRKYLRELLLNQKRVMETMAQKGLDARKEINDATMQVVQLKTMEAKPFNPITDDSLDKDKDNKE